MDEPKPEDSSTFLAEVAEVLSVDETPLEMLKVLDIVGLFWLKRLASLDGNLQNAPG